MSGHFAEALTPVAVLLASLAGSAHCASMCGGLVASVADSRPRWVTYQLGRLSGYLALGAVAGAIGGRFLNSGGSKAGLWLSIVAAVLLGGAFILSGVRIWVGKGLHFSVIPQAWLRALYRVSGGNALFSGALSGLLPCGWLHSFVLGAVATQSAVHGAVFLLTFWLGTLPALGLAPLLLQKFLRPLAVRVPRLCAMLLIVAGLASIGVKVPSVLALGEDAGGEVEACHDE